MSSSSGGAASQASGGVRHTGGAGANSISGGAGGGNEVSGGAGGSDSGGSDSGGSDSAGSSMGGAAASGAGGESGGATLDEARIVPEHLKVLALPGGNGVLEVVALTLRRGLNHTELYAALKNVGDIPACSAALSVELFDKAEQSLSVGIGGLLSQRFYRRTDGSAAIAACIGPGDVSMAAITDLPWDIQIADVGYAVYRCPYFALDVEPIDGLDISALQSVQRSAGTAYTGTLLNGLDVPITNPSVTVFSVNAAGRPLGAAMGSGTSEVPPGGSWTFETNAIDAPDDHYVAYPAAAIAESSL